MTTTTTERVYVRSRGYAQLLQVHTDHSATVSYEPASVHDGCDHPAADGTERVPFGDWVIEPDHPGRSIVIVKEFLQRALERDLGESFHVTNEGVGRGMGSWFTAWYGPFEVEITVTPRDLGPMTDTLARHVGDDDPYDGN
jgi:hypothetical protein